MSKQPVINSKIKMDQETKNAGNLILNKIGEKFKSFVNSFKMPSLADLIFKPTLTEAKKDAPPAGQNWTRLGLDSKIFNVVPVWVVIFLPALMAIIWFGKSFLQFLIEIISQFILVVPLLALGYFIVKSIKK